MWSRRWRSVNKGYLGRFFVSPLSLLKLKPFRIAMFPSVNINCMSATFTVSAKASMRISRTKRSSWRGWSKIAPLDSQG
ncbi:hypothetical protein ACOSQ2_013367 [Xanthoceras sorbifolium]